MNLLEFIASVCNCDAHHLHDDEMLNNITNNKFHLILQLEDAYEIKLDIENVSGLRTVGDLLNLWEQYGVNVLTPGKTNTSNMQSSQGIIDRVEMYEHAEKYLKNKNYSAALPLLRKIADDIDDLGGMFAVELICYDYTDELKISDNECFQYAYKAVNFRDYSNVFDEDNYIHTSWRFFINLLGCFYYEGVGCNVDYQKAFKLYVKAANLGFSAAMSNVGLCYKDGEGVEENHKQSLFWLLKAKEAGDCDNKETITQLCNQ